MRRRPRRAAPGETRSASRLTHPDVAVRAKFGERAMQTFVPRLSQKFLSKQGDVRDAAVRFCPGTPPFGASSRSSAGVGSRISSASTRSAMTVEMTSERIRGSLRGKSSASARSTSSSSSINRSRTRRSSSFERGACRCDFKAASTRWYSAVEIGTLPTIATASAGMAGRRPAISMAASAAPTSRAPRRARRRRAPSCFRAARTTHCPSECGLTSCAGTLARVSSPASSVAVTTGTI